MNRIIRVNERTLNVTDTTDTSQANIEATGVVVGKGKEDLTTSLRLVSKRCNRLLTDIDRHVRLRHRYFETMADKELYYSLEPVYSEIILKGIEDRTEEEIATIAQFEAIPTALEPEEWNERITDLDSVKMYIGLLEEFIAGSELMKAEL